MKQKNEFHFLLLYCTSNIEYLKIQPYQKYIFNYFNKSNEDQSFLFFSIKLFYLYLIFFLLFLNFHFILLFLFGCDEQRLLFAKIFIRFIFIRLYFLSRSRVNISINSNTLLTFILRLFIKNL